MHCAKHRLIHSNTCCFPDISLHPCVNENIGEIFVDSGRATGASEATQPCCSFIAFMSMKILINIASSKVFSKVHWRNIAWMEIYSSIDT